VTLHISFDESGDLEFNFENRRTSRFFVVTFLMTSDKRPIENVVKRVFRSLQKTAKKRSGGILHSHFEKKSTRQALLRAIAKRDVGITIMKIDKKALFLPSDPHALYIGMVTSLLNRLIIDGHLNPNGDIHFIASQMDTKGQGWQGTP
jgi:hypothetical protein